MRNDEFSRTEYEKFLVENNITASFFEKNLFNQERKKHLLDFIGGGIVPSNFMVNLSYDAINQKRNILLINLEDFFNREFNFSEEQIKTYYKNNKENYKEIYKSIKLLELNPLNLVNSDEYSDLFFKKIDELDDMIINGENFDVIAKKFNLPTEKKITLNRIGKDLNYKSIELIPDSLAQKIFDLGESQKTALFETQEKYFIVELIKTEEVQRKLDDVSLKKNISLTLKKNQKEISFLR